MRKREKPPSSTLYDPSTACPTMLSGLATSPNHSTTEWLHSLWSQSTPISLRYKLCFHTVSVDHLLVQHCLLKTEMTEHGGGRGGRLSGVVRRRSVHVWLEKRNTSAPILKHLHPQPFFFIKFKVRKGGEGEKHACGWVYLRERKRKEWLVFVGLCK